MLKNVYLTKVILFFLVLALVVEMFLVGALGYLKNVDFGNAEEGVFLLAQFLEVLERCWSLLMFLLGILLLCWLYKAHKNLSVLKVGNLRYSDASCVWWFFVPIFNLWKPYLALKETLKNSYAAANQPLSNMGAVLLWWLLSIVNSILIKLLLKAEAAIASTLFLNVTIFSYGIEIVLSILLFLIVYKINKCQQTAFRQAAFSRQQVINP